MHQNLLQAISYFIDLSLEEKEFIMKSFKFKSLKKKEQLCSLGSISKEVYFVKSGLLRLYYLHKGNEITAFLFSENLFASAFPSFLEQKPSEQVLEALENTEVFFISKDNLEQLYKDVPKFNIVTRKLAEQRFINAQRFFVSHLTQTPEERYRQFSQNFPDLIQRVPQHIIASFLGITPVSLSRIRNRKKKSV
ncbi:MAG: Crp/Fnr family transcriptional regulator [Chitinophagales bacterium]